MGAHRKKQEEWAEAKALRSLETAKRDEAFKAMQQAEAERIEARTMQLRALRLAREGRPRIGEVSIGPQSVVHVGLTRRELSRLIGVWQQFAAREFGITVTVSRLTAVIRSASSKRRTSARAAAVSGSPMGTRVWPFRSPPSETLGASQDRPERRRACGS